MAKIKAVDQAVVIESSLTNEQLNKAEKYFPEALTLTTKDENGKTVPTFIVATTTGKGDVGKFGISFPDGPKADKAAVTIQIAKMSKEKRLQFVKDEYGKILVNLNAVEKAYADAEKASDAAMKALDADIVVE